METKLGSVIEGPASRDAVHIAIAPVTAAVQLEAGEQVGFVDKANGTVGPATKPIGIVDPFLRRSVKAGERFYVVLFPGTVTGMRHHWMHPDFREETTTEDDKAASVAWLQNAAVRLGVSYEELIDDYSPLVNGDYINNGETICNVWYEISDEFWKHRKIVTGVDVENEGGFTCSC